MPKIVKIAGYLIIFLLSFSCYGQFVVPGSTLLSNFKHVGNNVPLGVLPMQYNSSFAGEADVPRFNSNMIYQRNNLGFFTSKGRKPYVVPLYTIFL